MMADAKAPTASYLSGDDPDIIEANRRYQEALAKLTESLDVRKNRFFDPTLLAVAEGFLGPSQTGSFGEALGRVAGKLGPAEAAALKEKQEIAQQQLGVATQGLELQRLKSRDAEIAKWLASDQKTPPPTGPLTGPQAAPVAGPKAGPLSTAPALAEPSEALVGALTQAAAPSPAVAPPDVPALPAVAPRPTTQGELPAVQAPKAPPAAPPAPPAAPPVAKAPEGIQIMPPNPAFMTQKEYIALNRNDKSKTFAEHLAKGAELEKKRYEKTEAGITDLRTGIFNPFLSGRYVEVPIMGEGYNGADYRVPENVAMQLTYLANQDNWAGYKALADKFTGKSFGAEDGSIQAKAQRAKIAEAKTEDEIKKIRDFDQRAEDATETLATSNVMRRFTKDPDFKKMTGILNNDKVSSGIATLVRDGIGGRGFTIGIPAIEDVMRNAQLSPEQQATYRTFLMYTAQMQLNAEKAMKGSTTERERLILGNANISPQDTAETVRRKADLLTAKAQFDRRVAREFDNSKMTAKQFAKSDKYMEMYDKYFEDISEIAVGLKAYQTPTAQGKPAANTMPFASSADKASPSLKAAQDRVRQEINKK
jgi:hypothetical protein